MADAKDILVGLLSSAYKLDEQGVAGLQQPDGSFKDEALDELLKLDQTRVATLKGEPADVQKIKDEYLGFGKRKALEDLEKTLRTEYGYKDATKQGKELIDAIIADKLKAATGSIDDKVKVHPLFLEKEQQVANLPKAIEEAVQAKEAELRGVFEEQRHQGVVASEAEVLFDELRPVLSKDARVAANQKRDFLEKVRSGKFKVSEKDGTMEIVPMSPDGQKRLEDNHGHAIPFKEYIRALVTERFDLHQSEDRSAGTAPGKVKGGDSDRGASAKLANKADYVREWGRIESEEKDLKVRAEKWAALKASAKEAGIL
jgi:hypothetical protein